MKKYSLKALCFSVMLAAGSFAYAQNGADMTKPAPPPAPPSAVDDETVDNFVNAYESVVSIQQNFSTQLSNADDPEQARELQQKAQDKMAEAVKDSGLTLSEYNDIVIQMDQDPELRERVISSIE